MDPGNDEHKLYHHITRIYVLPCLQTPNDLIRESTSELKLQSYPMNKRSNSGEN